MTLSELDALDRRVEQIENDVHFIDESRQPDATIPLEKRTGALIAKILALLKKETNYVTRDQLGQMFARLDRVSDDLKEIHEMLVEMTIDAGAEAHLFSDAVIDPRWRHFNPRSMRYSRQGHMFRSAR